MLEIIIIDASHYPSRIPATIKSVLICVICVICVICGRPVDHDESPNPRHEVAVYLESIILPCLLCE